MGIWWPAPRDSKCLYVTLKKPHIVCHSEKKKLYGYQLFNRIKKYMFVGIFLVVSERVTMHDAIPRGPSSLAFY